MFSTGAFNQIPMSFPYPGQQPPVSVYQSQYGGYAPQVQPPFQQVPPPSRGQSLPASGRQYPPATNGPYPPTSSRRNGQHPPPVPSQHYERHRHGSKSSKQHRKRRSASPKGAADQSLYSDKEEKNDRSRSPSLALGSQSKEADETNGNDQERRSPAVESTNADASQGGTIVTEDQQNSQEKDQRQSRSKKKKHYRHEQNQQQPPPPFYGELPPQMRVHQQPLYSGYSQAYEESIRRGDMFQKQAKRSTRLPPEVKQQLLPHEDDQQKQYPLAGFPQQPFRPPFNPYPPGFFSQTTPYNPPQPWPNMPAINHGPAEQEIQRLRSHIHTLEGELHKLQKKLNKTSINPDENHRNHRRSKADDAGAPRQTPVIVELNSGETNRESSSKKKHRHPIDSSQPGPPNPVLAAAENLTDQNSLNQQQVDPRERSRSGGNQLSETEGKAPPKSTREETAAQLAHAAAAHVNARQQVPPPPPVQQQQYVYQQGALPQQSQQIRGPAPRFPGPGNVRHPTDLAQQRNFNQSNNSELVDDEEERRNRRSADKILDAFERFYMTKSTTAPMKVKYIPEDSNSIHQRNTNNNNNNNYRERSLSQRSLSSSSSN